MPTRMTESIMGARMVSIPMMSISAVIMTNVGRMRMRVSPAVGVVARIADVIVAGLVVTKSMVVDRTRNPVYILGIAINRRDQIQTKLTKYVQKIC